MCSLLSKKAITIEIDATKDLDLIHPPFTHIRTPWDIIQKTKSWHCSDQQYFDWRSGKDEVS